MGTKIYVVEWGEQVEWGELNLVQIAILRILFKLNLTTIINLMKMSSNQRNFRLHLKNQPENWRML